MTMRAPTCALALASCLVAASPAVAADPILRHNAPTFPIAVSIEVPPGYSTIYLSGAGPDPITPPQDKTKPPQTLDAFGDTQTQVQSTLTKIAATLAGLHLGMGDVVQMHVYLAADPRLGKLDFAGMMKAYTRFFGTPAQPNLPTRSAFQVAALANPGWLVEIEVQAVRKP
jgi:enamine deaminase RidA (YjgF/YER057c/UK114 family)